MKIIKGLFPIFIVLALSACASSGKQVKYYSLTLNSEYQSSDHTNRVGTDKHHIVVDPIHLAKFLRQDGLVMQIGEHEIVTANYHRWAEPLEDAISKLLVQELNAKSNSYQFGRMVGQWNQNAILNLRLEFDKFHATDNAQIVASGRYWFYEKNKFLGVDQSFDISIGLTRDGYLHAVEKLEQVIGKLSEQIIDSFNHAKEY